MDTKTGAIAMFETLEDAVRAGYTKPLTQQEAALLRPLPREARVAYADMTKNQQKAFRRKLRGK